MVRKFVLSLWWNWDFCFEVITAFECDDFGASCKRHLDVMFICETTYERVSGKHSNSVKAFEDSRVLLHSFEAVQNIL